MMMTTTKTPDTAAARLAALARRHDATRCKVCRRRTLAVSGICDRHPKAFAESPNTLIAIGASGLHASVLKDIADGKAIDAARHVRMLVRHLRANGVIPKNL
jgi:hypothetical protein